MLAFATMANTDVIGPFGVELDAAEAIEDTYVLGSGLKDFLGPFGVNLGDEASWIEEIMRDSDLAPDQVVHSAGSTIELLRDAVRTNTCTSLTGKLSFPEHPGKGCITGLVVGFVRTGEVAIGIPVFGIEVPAVIPDIMTRRQRKEFMETMKELQIVTIRAMEGEDNEHVSVTVIPAERRQEFVEAFENYIRWLRGDN